MVTSIFRITPAQYVRRALGIWLERSGWLSLLPAVLTAIVGLYDWRLFIVALAMICIIYPGAMMLVYFNYALRTEAAFSTIPHQITLSPTGIDIDYFPDAETVKCPPSRHIPLSDIRSAEDSGSSVIFTLRSRRYDFILIPIAEFNGNFPSGFINLVNQA